ncbi:MAG: pre-peptidase C-terminal domain-containing protein, partial [Planctomycetales bacterium]|nr:pre-peptidase C-terminal domain-containing protein [Planctomycetales bacterium]
MSRRYSNAQNQRWMQCAATLTCILAFALTPREAALAADPLLQRLAPVGVQRGGQVRIVLEGQRLDPNAEQLLWEGEGVETIRVRPVSPTRVEALIDVAVDAPLGAHGVRLRNAQGLSNLLTLQVGRLPMVDEQEPNSDREHAQRIPLDATARGVVTGEDVDFFTVAVAAGERLSVEVEGMRLGNAFFDPCLTIYSPQGVAVGHSDDETPAHQDAYLSLVAAEAGDYVIEVRESALRGNGDSKYLLHVGRFPRPRAVFPPGGAIGEALTATFVGDPTGPITVVTRLPTNESEAHPLFCRDGRGASPSPLPLRVTTFGNAIENEPNDNVAEATGCTLPAGCCGVISRPGDADFYRFAAKKDETYDVRVFARQIRSPLDSLLRIRNAKGQNLAGNDDDRGQPDSYLRFRVPEDGEYVIEVTDHLGRGADDFVYRVEATPVQPIVDLTVEELRRYVSQHVEVPQSNRSAVMVRAARRDVGGELRLEIDGLPPGMTYEVKPLAADFDRIPVVFHAAADANPHATLASLQAVPMGESLFSSRFAHQTWLIRGANNVAVWDFWGRRLPTAVTDAAPFSITVRQPKAPLVQSGSLDLTVTAERREGFDEPISVFLLYNPPGVSSNASRAIGKGQNEVQIPVTAAGNARLGKWDLVVAAVCNAGGRRVTSSEF